MVNVYAEIAVFFQNTIKSRYMASILNKQPPSCFIFIYEGQLFIPESSLSLPGKIAQFQLPASLWLRTL